MKDILKEGDIYLDELNQKQLIEDGYSEKDINKSYRISKVSGWAKIIFSILLYMLVGFFSIIITPSTDGNKFYTRIILITFFLPFSFLLYSLGLRDICRKADGKDGIDIYRKRIKISLIIMPVIIFASIYVISFTGLSNPIRNGVIILNNQDLNNKTLFEKREQNGKFQFVFKKDGIMLNVSKDEYDMVEIISKEKYRYKFSYEWNIILPKYFWMNGMEKALMQ